MDNVLALPTTHPAKRIASILLLLAVLLGGFLSAAPAPAAHASSNLAPNKAALGSTVVSTAMKYVGYRYVYGGTSPRGFDCTGFVYYVYNSAGYNLPRDMYSMYNSGTRVAVSQMQPGDIVFFSGTYKRGLSHAGIYIGNGKFVNAANESVGVTVSNLWSSYWSSHFTAAVRPGR